MSHYFCILVNTLARFISHSVNHNVLIIPVIWINRNLLLFAFNSQYIYMHIMLTLNDVQMYILKLKRLNPYTT